MVASAAAFPARAQDDALYQTASWSEQVEPALPVRDEEEIHPRRLTLKDLERITAGGALIAENAQRSALEAFYSERIHEELEQFGYDLFDDAAEPPAYDHMSLPAGMVQEDYILSAGDRLDVVIRGQQNVRKTYMVDTSGLLVLDDFAPISAAGRKLGAVRADLENAASQIHNTQVFVSLAGIRQVGVLVAGHVRHPGRKMLTAFHTVMDALSAAGGIEKTGSLRRVKLIRKGRSETIDLYALLMLSGAAGDAQLQEGDRIIVPPVGPTVAVAGAVKRAGIYEIRVGELLALDHLLGFAGGMLAPGRDRFLKLEFTGSGEETVREVDDMRERLFGDGSVLMVAQAEQKRTQDVTLSGHTRQPGPHDIRRAGSLSALVGDEKALGSDIYPLIGLIERRDPGQLSRTFVEFSPRQVVAGLFDRDLAQGDVVHLFSMQQVRAIDAAAKDNPLLHKTSTVEPDKIEDPLMVAFLQERSAFVRGAVRQPGAYPVASGTTLDMLLATAGGMALEADTGNIEVTSRMQAVDPAADGRGTMRMSVNLHADNPADIAVGPGDTVRVNQKFHRVEDQSVTLLGEVAHPGRYDLMPGDTLLALLERAGGLSAQAYPAGAIFSRAAERKREEERYRAQARDLEMKLAASLQQVDDDKKPDMAQVAAVQSLITELKAADAVGRLTVEADPGALAADPEQDILLEAGDRIYIPKRPLTVRVGGEVLSPAALQFRKGKTSSDYIAEAGGTTYHADMDRAFVIYPEGSAQPLDSDSWSHNAVMIPPGSTIIVPRDPKPFDFLETAERISQVLANLAISGLYVDAIGDDD